MAYRLRLKANEDIFIDAGNNATVSGSEVKADRNISIDAENINIVSAENTATINTIHDYNQVGLTQSASQSNASLTAGFAQSNSDHEKPRYPGQR